MNRYAKGLFFGIVLLNLIFITIPMVRSNTQLKQENQRLMSRQRQAAGEGSERQKDYHMVSELQRLLSENDLKPVSERVSFRDGFQYEIVLSSDGQQGLLDFCRSLKELSPIPYIREAEIHFEEGESSSLLITYGDGE